MSQLRRREDLSGKFSVRRFFFLVLLATVIIVPVTRQGAAQDAGQRKTVTVTGRGATPAEAHNDAVRQALQQTVQQLVFADRTVENQKLVRDRIMSTMNGYVDSYRIVRKDFNSVNGIFAQEEEIVVSLTRIENFLGISLGASAELKGGILNTDAMREITQRDARGMIFDRLLTGLPASALEISFGSPTPDQRDPTQFIFPVTVRFASAWLASLRSGLRAIAVDAINWPLFQIHSEGILTAMKGPVGSSSFCIRTPSNADCFMLPPGHYGRTSMIGRQERELDFETPRLWLALRFVNASGGSTISGQQPCLVREIKSERHSTMLYRAWGNNGPLGRRYYLDTTPVVGNFIIKATEVDLATTTKFAGVPLFGAKSFGSYISMHIGNLTRLEDPAISFVPDMAGAPISRAAACGEMLNDALLARQRN